jgi:hypothetical protein
MFESVEIRVGDTLDPRIVGNLVPQGEEQTQGFRMRFGTGDAPFFLGLYNNPTEQEVAGALSGAVRVGLLESGRHTGFVLMHVEGMSDGWIDMPFTAAFSVENRKFLIPTHEAYVCCMVLRDQHQVVRAIRMFRVSPRFTSALNAMAIRQLQHAREFTVAAHQREILTAYTRWPKISDMARDAKFKERAGVPVSESALSDGEI